MAPLKYMVKRKERKNPLGAAAKERVRADPPARLGSGKKDVAVASRGRAGCVVSKTYRHRPYEDSAWECRYCAAAGPRELAGKEIWWGERRMECGC